MKYLFFTRNLWKNYCRDAINATQILFNNIESSNTNLKQIIQDIHVKLNDLESLFNYYFQITLNHSTRNEKFKKSTEKEVETLKFVPINVHLEKLFITNDSYEFASCGAFTFPHEYMKNNEFDGECSLISVFFYTLKNTIILTDEVKTCFTLLNSREQLLRCLYSIKSRIFIFSNEIVPIFTKNIQKATFILQNISIQSNDNQAKYILNEQLQFFKVKFDSFLINLNFLITNDQETNSYTNFLCQISSLIIEFLNIILTSFITKFEFVDNCALLSQSLTTSACSLHLRFYRYLQDNSLEKRIEFYKQFGILVQFESLLSCGTNESIKLADHMFAIKYLENVHIHLPNKTSPLELNASLFQIDFTKNGIHFYLYTNTTQNSLLSIRLVPILINVGINELAISSHLLGTSELQTLTINETYLNLNRYFKTSENNLSETKRYEISSCLTRYRSLLTSSGFNLFEKSRPTEFLQLTSQITRLLDGIRITNCKSGKDRTAMSISLEQCRLLKQYYHLSDNLFQEMLDQLRRNGTRIHIAFKNVGRAKYAFNKIRLNLLPKFYKCPQDCCVDELET